MPLTFRAECIECATLAELTAAPEQHVLDAQTSGPYTFVCAAGHTNLLVLQVEHFQMLFEAGVQAAVDQYYREAIADFAASLERFHQFFFEVFCQHHNLDTELRAGTWRLVHAQSERQLGMYLAAYASMCGGVPPTLGRTDVELRNGIIHRGELASEEDAIRYGQHVVDIQLSVIDRLDQVAREATIQTSRRRWGDQLDGLPEGRPRGIYLPWTNVRLPPNRPLPVDVAGVVSARRAAALTHFLF